MTYKFLNTIIDDLFAFVIKMPTLHRLSVFRDGKIGIMTSCYLQEAIALDTYSLMAFIIIVQMQAFVPSLDNFDCTCIFIKKVFQLQLLT